MGTEILDQVVLGLFIGMVILLLSLPVSLVIWGLMRLFRRHEWQYRNPHDRTCRVCGRHEVQHCWNWDWSRMFWEVFSEGDPGRHRR